MTDLDKYRDFNELFSTEQGKRVLGEIQTWGHLFKPSIPVSPIDPYLMAFKEGERNIVLKILYTMNNEPKEKPKRGNRHVD